ncbi:MAG TPA: PIN domain-containing protein [Longimicrobiaceae bacterium]|nr:PIN domain-containing protein [Longimicrobiaceae bacterium]
MTEVFVDTALAIALMLENDEHHDEAWAKLLDMRSRARLVTTRAVCLEIGSALHRTRHRAQASSLLASIDADPTFHVVPLSEDLYSEALELFQARTDKEWSLTDCVSFVVMRNRGITSALTTDHHFRQAGFEPLLA